MFNIIYSRASRETTDQRTSHKDVKKAQQKVKTNASNAISMLNISFKCPFNIDVAPEWCCSLEQS